MPASPPSTFLLRGLGPRASQGILSPRPGGCPRAPPALPSCRLAAGTAGMCPIGLGELLDST